MTITDEEWAKIKELPENLLKFFQGDFLYAGEQIHEQKRLCDFCEKRAISMQYGMSGKYFTCLDHSWVTSTVGSAGLQFWDGTGAEIKRIRY